MKESHGFSNIPNGVCPMYTVWCTHSESGYTFAFQQKDKQVECSVLL